MYPSKSASIFIKQNLTDLKRELDKPTNTAFPVVMYAQESWTIKKAER